jgi:hypothetical protein
VAHIAYYFIISLGDPFLEQISSNELKEFEGFNIEMDRELKSSIVLDIPIALYIC